jgi:hypothetical protein
LRTTGFMTTIFLSYSKKDYFFAGLAEIKLADGQINRDRGQFRAGSDWRYGIERGISESLVVWWPSARILESRHR